eukprot:PITA_22379
MSTDSTWFADIANYLVTGKTPPHLSTREKQNIIQKSVAYSWIQGDLFYTSPNLIIRRCVRDEEVFDVLKFAHDEPCGGHFADKQTAYKVLRAGYFWPSLFKNAKQEIVSDNGPQFISNLVQGVMEQYKIRHRKSMPYHLQANGQVKSINKVIESILTKTVNMHWKDWAERLLEALWAYKTTWRNSTRHTP